MALDQWSLATGNWSDSSGWSLSAPPGVNDTAEVLAGDSVGFGNPLILESTSIGSLVMDNGSELSISGFMTVGASGTGASLGGANASIFVSNGSTFSPGAGLTAGPGVTSAAGTVFLQSGSPQVDYTWEGGGSPATVTQVVDIGSNTFFVETPFYGSVTDLHQGGVISVGLGGGTFQSDTIGTDEVTEVFTTGTTIINFSGSTTYDASNLAVGSQGQISLNCFVTGTLIACAEGETAVERLRVGDRVATASGELKRIVWIGHRSLRGKELTEANRPVRIVAGAFGDGRPDTDLWLSPCHSVCVETPEEVLIPAGQLINGATVARQEVDEVTYWHIELESHDIVLANGLPAESYLDCGNRRWFEDFRGVFPLRRAPASMVADACRPLVSDGPVLEAVRDRLRAQAEHLGWTTTADMDLHLIADGQRIDPRCFAGEADFVVPAGVRQLALVSRTFIPGGGDQRELGVSITRLEIRGRIVRLDIPLEDPTLARGLHGEEAASGAPWRWTRGRTPIPTAGWPQGSAHVLLRLSFNPHAGRRWLAPQPPHTVGISQAA